MDKIPIETIQSAANDEEEESFIKPFTRELRDGTIEKIPYLEGTPKEIEELIKKCLENEIEKRPSIDEILEELLIIEEKHCLSYPHG